jgi:hypothetical protein
MPSSRRVTHASYDPSFCWLAAAAAIAVVALAHTPSVEWGKTITAETRTRDISGHHTPPTAPSVAPQQPLPPMPAPPREKMTRDQGKKNMMMNKKKKKKKDPAKHVLNMSSLSFHVWVEDTNGVMVFDPEQIGGLLEKSNSMLLAGRQMMVDKGMEYIYEAFDEQKSHAVQQWCENKATAAQFERLKQKIRAKGPQPAHCYGNSIVFEEDSPRTDLKVVYGSARWEHPDKATRTLWEYGNPAEWRGVHW